MSGETVPADKIPEVRAEIDRSYLFSLLKRHGLR